LIASVIDGRIRLRDPRLKDSGLISRITSALAKQPGIEEVIPNPRVGSLLVRYETGLIASPKVAEVLERLLPGARRPEAASAPSGSKPPGRSGASPCLPLSRRQCTHLGMMVSLAGSLAALTVKSKTLHVQLGILFVAFSLIHMFDKRQRLLA